MDDKYSFIEISYFMLIMYCVYACLIIFFKRCKSFSYIYFLYTYSLYIFHYFMAIFCIYTNICHYNHNSSIFSAILICYVISNPSFHM